MDIAAYIAYFNETMSKTTVGSSISIGLFAFLGVLAVMGVLLGATRGFVKTVIRILTIGLSAGVALFAMLTASDMIVNTITTSDASNLYEFAELYAPGALAQAPAFITDILMEIPPETAAIIIMMIVSLIILPLVFIIVFYILKTITLLVYWLLSGLSGAVSVGNGITSMALGAAAGAVQGALVAAIVLVPLSGIASVASSARETLVGADDTGKIESAYKEYIDDVINNPLFETVRLWGGEAAYAELTTVEINNEKLDMTEESEVIFKLAGDVMPFTDPNFNWEEPSEMERNAYDSLITEIGDSELIASLTSDIMRGVAKSVEKGDLPIPLEGTTLHLAEEILIVFKDSNKDNIEGDLHTVLDVYLILCDRGLLSAFTEGNKNVLREMLSDKGEDGKTSMDVIIATLQENPRMVPVVTTFTKLTLSIMHDSLGLQGESAEVYDNLKEPLKEVLSLNKNDEKYAGNEEAYKQDVKDNLNNALSDQGITLNEDVQNNMVDYIADNYGDSDEEITDKHINDALLSYFNAYSKSESEEGVEENIAYTVTVVDQNGDAVVGAKVFAADGGENAKEGLTGDDGKVILKVAEGVVLANIRIMEAPEGYTIPDGFVHGIFAEGVFEAIVIITKD